MLHHHLTCSLAPGTARTEHPPRHTAQRTRKTRAPPRGACWRPDKLQAPAVRDPSTALSELVSWLAGDTCKPEV